MLTKMTAKKQITLPTALLSRFGDVNYFEVSTDGETITLRPLRRSRADEVREQLAKQGLNEADVTEAAKWSRDRG